MEKRDLERSIILADKRQVLNRELLKKKSAKSIIEIKEAIKKLDKQINELLDK